MKKKVKVILEIAGGEVSARLEGFQGKECMSLADVWKKLGEVKELKKTSDYYRASKLKREVEL